MYEMEIKKVPFMGTELMAARDTDGQIWAGVRWMCDGIGFSEGQRKRQIANIQEDTVLSKGGSNLILPTKGGTQRTLCLKLDFVPLWLAKISITPTMKQETPELAEKLMEYQLKAKDVLAAAFMPTAGGYTKFSKELQAIFMLDARTMEQDRRITALEESMVIDYSQQRILASHVNTMVIRAMDGADSPAYRDKNVRGRVYSECNRDIQKWFRVNSRNNIPRKRFEEAVEYILRWRPSTNMTMIIRQANRQTQF